MTVAIPQGKLTDVLNECNAWLTKKQASRHMIQSLVGKLLHLGNAIPHARKFTSRILNTLRYMASNDKLWTSMNDDFRADVGWFLKYAERGNGVSLFAPTIQFITIECDSSLHTGGGNSELAFYTWRYPDSHKLRFSVIHHLEAVNVIVAYKCAPASTRGKCVVIFTDNNASSYTLMTGRTKESWRHAPVSYGSSQQLQTTQ